MNVVTANVKKLIATRGIKQKYIAQKMGLSEPEFSNIMNGRKILKPEIVPLLCDALDVTPNELFGYNTSA